MVSACPLPGVCHVQKNLASGGTGVRKIRDSSASAGFLSSMQQLLHLPTTPAKHSLRNYRFLPPSVHFLTSQSGPFDHFKVKLEVWSRSQWWRITEQAQSIFLNRFGMMYAGFDIVQMSRRAFPSENWKHCKFLIFCYLTSACLNMVCYFLKWP